MNEKAKPVSTTAIGQNLWEHSKSFGFEANRGLVIELFPFLFGAFENMSARAISRALKEKQGVKLSAVTITKALNDPKKSWNQFFDTIESHVAVYEKSEKRKREDFLYDDKRFKVLLPELPGRETLRKYLWEFEVRQAIDVLREKWFSIDLAIRLKARPYLADRLRAKEMKGK